MNKKLFLKLGGAGAAAILLWIAVIAARPTEASDFELKVGDSCTYNGAECVWNKALKKYAWQGTGEPCVCAWKPNDLAGELFFDLDDVKPGDRGQNIARVKVFGQAAWLCAQILNVRNFENSCTGEESSGGIDQTCGNPGPNLGELQDYLRVTVWQDANCNKKIDNGEPVLINNGELKNGIWPVADSARAGKPVKAGGAACLGIDWNVPLVTGNIIQTDSVMADIKFTAVAAANNMNYVCGGPVCQPKTEVCDGADNDCDGKTDEGSLWKNLGKNCTVGKKNCQKTGVYVCDPANRAGKTICSAAVDPNCRPVNGAVQVIETSANR